MLQIFSLIYILVDGYVLMFSLIGLRRCTNVDDYWMLVYISEVLLVNLVLKIIFYQRAN